MKFDKFFEVRISGISSEDFSGIPIKTKDENNNDIVQFALLDWMRYIELHPEERILVFLDK